MIKKKSRERKDITSIQTLMILKMTTLINLDHAAGYDEDSNDNDVVYESDDSSSLSPLYRVFGAVK